jgi:hypothetical protein
MGEQWNPDEYRELLDDLCSEYCEKGHYCILKEFLVAAHSSRRLLMQLKCVEKMKYEESKKRGTDLTWKGAWELWVEDGSAKKFADYYDEKIKFAALYKKIKNGNGA